MKTACLRRIHGKVVLLMAQFETLVERLQNDSVKRPLLTGDLNDKLASLLASRKEHYNSFPFISICGCEDCRSKRAYKCR